METLFEKSEMVLSRVETNFKRYLLREINWNNRLIGIKGARGTGKTTLLLQRLHELGLNSNKAIYISLDDLFFTTHALNEVAESFYKQGGKYLFLDEVHKYKNWSRAIKNLYDFYPDLQIVFTGSSIIDISREEADLSRRVLMYELHGLSLREYIAYKNGLVLSKTTLEELVNKPLDIRNRFPNDFRPLQYFKSYLTEGYYPFFKEDVQGYHQRLQQLVRIIVEYDMAELADFDIRNAKKMLQLLGIIAENVPFKPNVSSLAQKSGIHRNTISSYFSYLEQARLIHQLYPSGISTAILQKPEKIYLNNPNLAYALSVESPNEGNLRETFFINQIKVNHRLSYPRSGDFKVDEKYTFEIGGLNKGAKQLEGVENAMIIKDNLEYPIPGALPLWIFGFLY